MQFDPSQIARTPLNKISNSNFIKKKMFVTDRKYFIKSGESSFAIKNNHFQN